MRIPIRNGNEIGTPADALAYLTVTSGAWLVSSMTTSSPDAGAGGYYAGSRSHCQVGKVRWQELLSRFHFVSISDGNTHPDTLAQTFYLRPVTLLTLLLDTLCAGHACQLSA